MVDYSIVEDDAPYEANTSRRRNKATTTCNLKMAVTCINSFYAVPIAQSKHHPAIERYRSDGSKEWDKRYRLTDH